MGKYLLIVESPNKCAKIKSYLGADYTVLASVGHIRQIPKKGMNIDIKNGFEPTYEISSDKKDVVKKIKEAAKGVDKIYLATDPDREGSAIAWGLYELFDEKTKKKCTRVMFSEINKSAILKAIKEETKIEEHMPLIQAAKARQVLDRLIGYKISPILWHTVGMGTSAGRVQSIALKMVCQRENEIKSFKPQDFWYIDALMGYNKDEFWARVITKDKDNRYLDEKITSDDYEKLKVAKFKLDKIDKNERTVKPSPPFDTASLQITCSSLFGWSIKKTASLSQHLYETGKCFLPGTKITLPNGEIVNIEDFCDGNNNYEKSVFSVDSFGKTQIVSDCLPVMLNHSGKIHEIKTINDTIKVTDDHIFPIYDSLLGKVVDKTAKDINIDNDYFMSKNEGMRSKIKFKTYKIYDLLSSSDFCDKILFRFKDGFFKDIESPIRLLKGLNIKESTAYKYIRTNTLPLNLIKILIDSKVFGINYIESNYTCLQWASPASKPINVPVCIDTSLCLLAGLVASDGHLHKSKINLSSLTDKNPNGIDISKYVDIKLEINKLMARFNMQNSDTLNYSNNILVSLLNNLGVPCGKKSSKIDFSNIILSSGIENIKAYIAGLFDGDGYFTYNKISNKNRSIQGGYTSKSLNLINKLKIVLSQFNIMSKIHCDNRNGCYTLKISIYDMDKFYTLIKDHSLIKARVYEMLIKELFGNKKHNGNGRNPRNKPIIVAIERERQRIGMTKEKLSNASKFDYWSYFSNGNNIPEDCCNNIATILDSKDIAFLSQFNYEKIISNEQKDYNGNVYCLQTVNNYFLVESGILTHNCTYIRSDSFNISEEALAEVRGFIKNSSSSEYLPKTAQVYTKKSKAVASQEAHECIRPTHCDDDGETIDEDDAKKLYKLIRSRFIACQMSPMIVDTVAYNIKSSSNHNLIAKGQTIKFDGWYSVYKYTGAKEEILPDIKEKEMLELKESKKTKNTTQPPARYNEGSLVKKLESEGVGRPSTYASIMESLNKREYVKKIEGKKGAMEATVLGMSVFNYLDPNFKNFFMDVEFTASVEDDLDKITNGEKDYLGVVGAVYNLMQEEIKKAEISESKNVTTGEKCLACDSGYIIKRHGKFGDFWSCDKYSKTSEGCKAIYDKNEDGTFKIKEKKSQGEDSGAKCSVCKKGSVLLKKGKFGDFFCCSEYPDCKTVFIKDEDGKFSVKAPKDQGKDTGKTCLICKKGKIISRSGQYGEWFSCNLYPKCKSVFIKGEKGNFELKKKNWKKASGNEKDEE